MNLTPQYENGIAIRNTHFSCVDSHLCRKESDPQGQTRKRVGTHQATIQIQGLEILK